MIGERTLPVLALCVAAGGCMSGTGSSSGPDAAPMILYQPFVSTTWSLSMMGGAAQLSITDGTGAAACALSTDHKLGLPAAGKQIILRLPGMVTGTCPAGNYTIFTHCQATLGSEAYVPEGCAFYQQWDAQGTPLGFAVALNGEITIAGTDASCSIRANVGFLGATFSELFTLTNGAGAQPWCGT